MVYSNTVDGVFLERPNRFIARVLVDGEEVVSHVKNTGRCRELLIPGAAVSLQRAENPGRKTPFDLIAVRKKDRWINIDSQAPNVVFREWVEGGGWDVPVEALRSEVRYGASRFDFQLRTAAGTTFVEVKGVTLEEDGVARFPDAPTERGVKHLEELLRSRSEGYHAAVVFILQMRGMRVFRPNWETHAAFGEALLRAQAGGVRVIALGCCVSQKSLVIDGPVPLDLRRPE